MHELTRLDRRNILRATTGILAGLVVAGSPLAHDIPNLFISDGSVLSTPGSANPTLTIVALALRQAEYIAQQVKAADF
jgi:choline dehydrogenase-like flavoprotein